MAGDQNPQQRVMPTLRMTDYARSKQFYVEGLGFQVDWEHRFEPSRPVLAQVSRDGLAFFLTETRAIVLSGGLSTSTCPTPMHGFDDCRRKGVRVQEPPNEGLPGLRSMTVVDPDGNKLSVCTRLPDWHR